MQIVTRFPSHLYHVVWRNWDFLPAARLARLLKCSVPDVRRMADDLGLAAQPQDPVEDRLRYRSLIIRRNWHLLPASQIAALVGMEEAVMEQFMREDDFLDLKLPLKPSCRPVEYHAPLPSKRLMARQMAETLAAMPEPSTVEPSFAFLESLKKGRDDVVPVRIPEAEHWALTSRIMHPLTCPTTRPLSVSKRRPVACLRLLHEFGADALWFPVVVFNLVRLADYLEFGQGREAGLKYGAGCYKK